MSTDLTGLGMAFGTAQDGREWEGRKAPERTALAPVSETMIHHYAALVEDGNPRYWIHGVCPPGLALTLGFEPPWLPDREPERSLFALQVPLPGHHVINVETDTEFFRDIRAGDRITICEEVVSVSEEKSTRLGRGHFVTSRSTYRNQDGETCVVNTNILYRYESHPES